MAWNWEQPDWPEFTYHKATLEPLSPISRVFSEATSLRFRRAWIQTRKFGQLDCYLDSALVIVAAAADAVINSLSGRLGNGSKPKSR